MSFSKYSTLAALSNASRERMQAAQFIPDFSPSPQSVTSSDESFDLLVNHDYDLPIANAMAPGILFDPEQEDDMNSLGGAAGDATHDDQATEVSSNSSHTEQDSDDDTTEEPTVEADPVAVHTRSWDAFYSPPAIRTRSRC